MRNRIKVQIKFHIILSDARNKEQTCFPHAVRRQSSCFRFHRHKVFDGNRNTKGCDGWHLTGNARWYPILVEHEAWINCVFGGGEWGEEKNKLFKFISRSLLHESNKRNDGDEWQLKSFNSFPLAMRSIFVLQTEKRRSCCCCCSSYPIRATRKWVTCKHLASVCRQNYGSVASSRNCENGNSSKWLNRNHFDFHSVRPVASRSSKWIYAFILEYIYSTGSIRCESETKTEAKWRKQSLLQSCARVALAINSIFHFSINV